MPTFNLFVLLILNCILPFGNNLNYCNKRLCAKGLKHIACNNDGKMNSTCAEFSEIIELTPEIKANIVDKHNEYRNKLALGEVPGFESATRMATMQWHEELARMAQLNLQSCTTTHDVCRNTNAFPKSGQNIAQRTTSSSLSLEEVEGNIYRGIDQWFQENENCPKDGTTKYTSSIKKYGHFTVMITEHNTHLGCALLLMNKNKTILTCNYGWNNFINMDMYRPGEPASDCKTGKNENYPGLCSTEEVYK